VGVPGHWETRYKMVEEWVPCDKTFIHGGYILDPHHYDPDLLQQQSELPKNVFLWTKDEYMNSEFLWNLRASLFPGDVECLGSFKVSQLGGGETYKAKVLVMVNHSDGKIYAIKHKCYEVLNGYKEEAYSVWVPPDWKKEWVVKRYLVPDGYWKYIPYKVWVDDKSFWVEEKTYENQKMWVDGYYENSQEWVPGYYENQEVWVDGFYTSPLHGEVIVEKSPRYIFTRWHKDQNNEECNMELNVSWKVDNSNLSEGGEEKENKRKHKVYRKDLKISFFIFNCMR